VILNTSVVLCGQSSKSRISFVTFQYNLNVMWHQVIDYFQELEKHPVQRMAFLVSGLLIFWIIEGSIPLISLRYKKTKLRHAAINFGFTVIHLLIHTFLAIIIVLLSDWSNAQQFGLVYWTNAGILGTIVISFLVLDFFGGWLVHITEHKVGFLWRFHVVHHADNNVDVTTGLRHHPVESVLRGIFFFFGIVVSGAPMYAVMIFQTLLVLSTAFTHANISLPRWLDKGLSFILVSPNMHKVHHHWKQPYTDSNYGAILSIWDRLLGTFMKLEPKDIRYGLDRYYPNDKDEDFVMLMKKPFQKLDP
jgi:sterol desaturase/sphingolipid hydroxylase (fatty acid hydroxylase superfamily)